MNKLIKLFKCKGVSPENEEVSIELTIRKDSLLKIKGALNYNYVDRFHNDYWHNNGLSRLAADVSYLNGVKDSIRDGEGVQEVVNRMVTTAELLALVMDIEEVKDENI